MDIFLSANKFALMQIYLRFFVCCAILKYAIYGRSINLTAISTLTKFVSFNALFGMRFANLKQ
jgi:hypothetical protein